MIKLPQKLYELANSCIFPLYVVGGTVRDELAHLSGKYKDFDICAPVTAEEFEKVCTSCGGVICNVYKNTGTVKFKMDECDYEFASFRSDEYIRGVHNPVNTFFTEDITLDAKRRDFKCNAVYYDIKKGEYVDPLGGIRDICGGVISTVAPADKVFGEDGLRLMRLARQAAQTGFIPTKECLQGAKNNKDLIKDVSLERIYAELNGILHADERYGKEGAQYTGLKILDEIGVLEIILPEVCAGRGVEQRKDYHKYDVLEHSLRAVKYARSDVRLAALLHDTGKVVTFKNEGNFHMHEEYSAKIAVEVCERLKVSKKLTEETRQLCLLHMYDINGNTREGKVRKFIVRHYDILDKLYAIKQADFSACRDDLYQAPFVEKWKRIEEDMKKEGAPFKLSQLNVRGNELIDAGISPNEVGKTLLFLLDECAIDPTLNKKKKLVNLARGVNKIK
jgi:tRNA nucleotidyltransferase (CCA-adding enzyme)